MQKYTGAQVFSSEKGAAALRAGDLLEDDPQFNQPAEYRSFPAVRNVAAIEDGESLAVGGAEITGLYTPGHTPGGVSWTWQSCENDRCLNIVYGDTVSPVSAAGYRFTDGLGEAVRSSAERIGALDCDILLATHPFIFDLDGKFAQGRDAFIDDTACANYRRGILRKLQKRLAEEDEASR